MWLYFPLTIYDYTVGKKVEVQVEFYSKVQLKNYRWGLHFGSSDKKPSSVWCVFFSVIKVLDL